MSVLPEAAKAYVGVESETEVACVGVERSEVRRYAQAMPLPAAGREALPTVRTGTGQTTHLAWVQFAAATQMELVHVPYKGGAQALTELLAGQIQLMFGNPLESVPQVKANKIRALAVSSAKRSRAMPELPTLMEAGVPNFEVSGWYGVVAPAATPRPFVAALNAGFVQALRMPDVIERFAKDGIETVGSTPEQFQHHLRSETERWRRVAASAGIARP